MYNIRYYYQILMNLEFSGEFFFSKNALILNFMEILPVGAKLFRADRRTDRHVEANIRFSQFCGGALNRASLMNCRNVIRHVI
jgi:hypothetical protein